MTISANSMTLADYAIMSNEPMVRAITYSLIENGSAMQDIPFVNQDTLIANGVRWEGNLPTVDWVSLNTEGSTTTGTPTPYQEQAYIVRNYIDTDKFLVRDRNQIVDPRAARADAYLKALTYDFNDKFLNNNHISGDKDSVVGIRARIDNGSTYGVRSANKINGSGVDLRQANATQATANQFLELLDQLLWSVDSPDGMGVILYVNEVMKRRFSYAMRLMGTQGGLSTQQDQFNRTIEMYKGAIIRDIGYKSDQTTRIITTTEDTAGANGSSTYTSIYAAKYDMSHFFGWQFGPPNVQDLGLLENGAQYRTLIDWACGLMNASNRSLGRLYGIRLA
jgi:hypothetical protein